MTKKATEVKENVVVKNYKEIAKTLRLAARDMLRTKKINELQSVLGSLDTRIAGYKERIEAIKKDIKAFAYAIGKADLEKASGLDNPDYDNIVTRNNKSIESCNKEIESIEKDILATKKEKSDARKKQNAFATGELKFKVENIEKAAVGMIENYFTTQSIKDADLASLVKAEILSPVEKAEEAEVAATGSNTETEEDFEDYDEEDED